MRTNETSTTFDLDGETLAMLVNLCTKYHQTPSQIIGGIIREKAEKSGLLNNAQSA